MTHIETSLTPPRHVAGRQADLSASDTAMHKAARKLEASFIKEMLVAVGLGKPRDSFGGGAGEEAFGSFMVEAQAEKIAESGGFGLAEAIFEALREGGSSYAR